jgi:AbiU2
MVSIAKFKSASKTVRAHVDVLVQFSEIYYLMSKLKSKKIEEPGGQTFLLLWRAVGFELASRLYRLLEKADLEHLHLGTLNEMLSDDLLEELFVAANKHSRTAFRRTRNEIAKKLSTLRGSASYGRVAIFRQRFVAHRVTNPRDLKKYPWADVQDLKIADLIYLIEGVGLLTQKIAVLEGKPFRWKRVAEDASQDAKDLWDPTPNSLSSVLAR